MMMKLCCKSCFIQILSFLLFQKDLMAVDTSLRFLPVLFNISSSISDLLILVDIIFVL